MNIHEFRSKLPEHYDYFYHPSEFTDDKYEINDHELLRRYNEIHRTSIKLCYHIDEIKRSTPSSRRILW